MARTPKFFVSMRSANLTPDLPVHFKVRVSTHHWRGQLLENTWASASLKYSDVYHTEGAYEYLKETFLAYQENELPEQNIVFPYPDDHKALVFAEDREYLDIVKEATECGWTWEHGFTENLLTGIRSERNSVYPITLSTWEWAGIPLGAKVQIAHPRRAGESDEALLARILQTAEKARVDFPDSIPTQSIRDGLLVADNFATMLAFGKK